MKPFRLVFKLMDEPTPEVLTHPQNRRHIQRMRRGQPLELPSISKHKWPRKTLRQIEAWLKAGGTIDGLANLLQSNPFAIVHPVVSRQITHLHKIRSGDLGLLTHEEVDTAVQGQKGSTLDIPKKNILLLEHPRVPYREDLYDTPGLRAVESALETLVKSWVKGLFPTRRLQITPRPSRGRPGDPVNKLYVYLTISNIQKHLNKLGATLFMKKTTESVNDFIARVAKEVSALQDEPILIVYKLDAEEGQAFLFPPRNSLPLEKVEEAVKESLSAQGRRVNKKVLSLHLVRRWERKTLRALHNIFHEVSRDYRRELRRWLRAH